MHFFFRFECSVWTMLTPPPKKKRQNALCTDSPFCIFPKRRGIPPFLWLIRQEMEASTMWQETGPRSDCADILPICMYIVICLYIYNMYYIYNLNMCRKNEPEFMHSDSRYVVLKAWYVSSRLYIAWLCTRYNTCKVYIPYIIDLMYILSVHVCVCIFSPATVALLVLQEAFWHILTDGKLYKWVVFADLPAWSH